MEAQEKVVLSVPVREDINREDFVSILSRYFHSKDPIVLQVGDKQYKLDSIQFQVDESWLSRRIVLVAKVD